MIEFQFLMLFSVISGRACHWKSQQPKSPDIHPWLEIILAKSGVCDHHHGTNGFWISGPEIIRINTVRQIKIDNTPRFEENHNRRIHFDGISIYAIGIRNWITRLQTWFKR
jgi:hypothetical protein